jgi:hypothetical protein
LPFGVAGRNKLRVLPEGERAKLLRILMESRTAEQKEALKRQLMSAGFNVLQLAAYFAGRKYGYKEPLSFASDASK